MRNRTHILIRTACLLCALWWLSAPAKATVKLVSGTTGAHIEINGQPMLLLGGELSNSAATSVADIQEVFPRMQALGLNTLLVPLQWDLTEPCEGRFDFTLLDTTVKAARECSMKVVFLWFGAWKNSMSCYAPAWFKADVKRFPRAVTAEGKPLEIASAFSEQVFRADSAAFTAVMRHIKDIDATQNTVVMMQIENEIGMLESARDHSTSAEKAYKKTVPSALLHSMGLKKKGSWADVFGQSDSGDEIFMAWHYAKYVERLAKTARAIHDIPLYVNAAMNSRGRKPGEYPSAGPLAHLMPVWKTAAPSVDLMAPDIYDTGFKNWAKQYATPNNPLFIPESRCCSNSGARALYVFGAYDAVGFSPFAIDNAAADAKPEIQKSYAALREAAPLLLSNKQGKAQKSWGVLFDQTDKDTLIADGETMLQCAHYFTLPWDPRATNGSTWREGGAIIKKLAEKDYLIIGSGVVITFLTNSEWEQKKPASQLGEDGFATAGSQQRAAEKQTKRFKGKRLGLASVEEVSVNDDGTTSRVRSFCGDETHQGRHVRISVDDYKVLRVKLYEYQ